MTEQVLHDALNRIADALGEIAKAIEASGAKKSRTRKKVDPTGVPSIIGNQVQIETKTGQNGPYQRLVMQPEAGGPPWMTNLFHVTEEQMATVMTAAEQQSAIEVFYEQKGRWNNFIDVRPAPFTDPIQTENPERADLEKDDDIPF